MPLHLSKCWFAVGQLSVNCWYTAGRQLTDRLLGELFFTFTEFLRIEVSLFFCHVDCGCQTRNAMSVKSFLSNKPQSVAGGKKI